MDFFSLLIGAAASILAVTIGLVTLAGRITRKAKKIVREVLVETGLIRYSRVPTYPEWPNGWDNLPDALEGLHQKIDRHHP